jgi:hypothetical protein
MLKFASDENLNGAITRGLQRRLPNLDIVRLQDVGLKGYSDPDVLVWAASENRILLTHDIRTLRQFAEGRIHANLKMPGVFEIAEHVSIRGAIEDLVLIATCSGENEWEGKILFLPLR